MKVTEREPEETGRKIIREKKKGRWKMADENSQRKSEVDKTNN